MRQVTTQELQQASQDFFRGVQAVEAGQLQEAVRCFEAALALAPGRPSVLVNLGLTHYRLGQHAMALPLLRQAAAVDAASADAWAFLGLTHEALGQWQAGADALQRALALAPAQAGLWLSLGHCLLQCNAVEAALRAFDQAVAAGPTLARAWSERGGLLRELGRLPEAALCFEQALALGADPALHGYYLASVRGTHAPANPPRQYVEALFDTYASDFQQHLVGQLRYQAHETLVRPLLQANRRYHSVLDLGCGSGLCGQLLHGHADAIDGVDVSSAMLAQARQHGVYRALVHAELGAFLAQANRADDLVLAADVFIYIGELSEVFQQVRRILRPAGCFAFSVELSPGGQDVHLLPSLRYAHSERYVLNLAQTHGFKPRDRFTAPLRHDQGAPVQGLYVLLDG
jgi:predicted TPR repeat methyltransferase